MKDKLYFAGLDGLRFIAISFVTLHHFFTFRNYYDGHAIEVPVIGRIGYAGIQFFFAGSGFLITYLLLAEHQKRGRISLPKFYLRRILRIWPAYYLLIILALLILNYAPFFNIPTVTDVYLNADYKTANTLYFSFLPHFAGIYFPTAPYIHQTYTIGMEEQFYFLWGLIFFFSFKRVKLIFVLLLLLIPVLHIVNTQIVQHKPDNNWLWHKYDVFIFLLRYFRLPTFALGALWALAYFNNKKWTKIFEQKWVQLVIYSVLVISIGLDWSLPYFKDEYLAFLMLCLLSCAMTHQKSIINYEWPPLRFLGRISYGIYLFHIIAIVVTIKIVSSLGISLSSFSGLCILIVGVLLLATVLGWLSYVTVERYFLGIKKRITNF